MHALLHVHDITLEINIVSNLNNEGMAPNEELPKRVFDFGPGPGASFRKIP